MPQETSLDLRLAAAAGRLGPTEARVAEFLRSNREDVLVSSARALASRLSTSDATIIRTVQALGYAGLSPLRRELAGELRNARTPAARLARTLGSVGRAREGILQSTLEDHQRALERLKHTVSPAVFASAVATVVAAPRVFIFGMGPSGALAGYFALQLARFGLSAASLTDSGPLLADGLNRLRRGDLLIMFAFTRVYGELCALITRAATLRLATVLITDVLGAQLRHRVDHVLPVERGRADALSLHTATLGLIEALLVGIAARRPGETLASLKRLASLRAAIAKT
jgi:DNA-binding MurR/RpiR family transcriptional regulator